MQQTDCFTVLPWSLKKTSQSDVAEKKIILLRPMVRKNEQQIKLDMSIWPFLVQILVKSREWMRFEQKRCQYYSSSGVDWVTHDV